MVLTPACFVNLKGFTKTQQIYTDNLILPNEAIATGNQYLFYEAISDVSSLQKFKAVFNDEVTLIGYPVNSGRGNACFFTRSMSVYKNTTKADICWSFMKGFFDAIFQYENITFFPTNEEAFLRRIAQPELHEEAGVILAYQSSDNRQFPVVFRKPTQAESSQVKDLVYSLDRVYRPLVSFIQLVYHYTEAFYTGEKDASETTDIIQQLALNYLNERITINSE